MKLAYVIFDKAVTIPGGQSQVAGLRDSTRFDTARGFDITYDVRSGLIVIQRDSRMVAVPYSRIVECEVSAWDGLPLPPTAVPAPQKPRVK